MVEPPFLSLPLTPPICHDTTAGLRRSHTDTNGGSIVPRRGDSRKTSKIEAPQPGMTSVTESVAVSRNRRGGGQRAHGNVEYGGQKR
ncbi:hypothetical protein GCM10022220_36920 [Actinocatenispora rupis]|uniref:Uncharacterized protein n=1 Tax=Actinocatenispora rupis TaxID=519421 RepID=A0A8J3NCS9_9ACTN|nr:hypothetical protein Aru02nite_31040 [Actinocatenispora rupis]